MSYHFDPPDCDRRFRDARNDFLRKALRRATEIQQLKQEMERERREADRCLKELTEDAQNKIKDIIDQAERLRVRERELEAAVAGYQSQLGVQSSQLDETLPHVTLEHAAKMARGRANLRVRILGFVALTLALSCISFLQTEAQHWVVTLLWILVFGGLVGRAFYFYYPTRPMLVPVTCGKCFIIWLGIVGAVLSPLWGLCQNLDTPLGDYRVELFMVALGALVWPEIASWLRRDSGGLE